MAKITLSERLQDFREANDRLREAVLAWQQSGNELFRDAMIQRFEFTFELAWKTTQDWLRLWETDLEIAGPRQVLAAAVSRNVIGDGNLWTQMLADRNLTTHLYNRTTIVSIADRLAILSVPAFEALIDRLSRDG